MAESEFRGSRGVVQTVPSPTPARGPAAIFLCDVSTVAAQPWAAAGYPCVCVDLQHDGRQHDDGIVRVSADVREWRYDGLIAFVAAFPPCTDLAVSGARWFKGKGLRRLAAAIDVFGACVDFCQASDAPYFIENPVSVISSHYRKPDHTFQPCDYAGYADDPAGEAYDKRTCLWTGGGFVMPAPRPVAPLLGSKMHLLPPSPERANLRSVTPQGFARAVFAANSRKAVTDVA